MLYTVNTNIQRANRKREHVISSQYKYTKSTQKKNILYNC